MKTKTELDKEQCPECTSKRLFKCGKKRKCLDCGCEFEAGIIWSNG